MSVGPSSFLWGVCCWFWPIIGTALCQRLWSAGERVCSREAEWRSLSAFNHIRLNFMVCTTELNPATNLAGTGPSRHPGRRESGGSVHYVPGLTNLPQSPVPGCCGWTQWTGGGGCGQSRDADHLGVRSARHPSLVSVRIHRDLEGVVSALAWQDAPAPPLPPCLIINPLNAKVTEKDQW